MAGLKHKRKAKTDLDMQNQYLNAAFSEFIRAKEGDNLAKETIDAYKTSYKRFVDCFGKIMQSRKSRFLSKLFLLSGLSRK